MKVHRLFPRTLEEGAYLEDVAVFSARCCRTIKDYDELWEEVNGYSTEHKGTFLDRVVSQDWALDILEMTHLVHYWADIPVWLIIELLRHRHIARDFSLEQLSQRAISGLRLKVETSPALQSITDKYLDDLNAELAAERIKPEELRESLPQGVLVNLVIAGNLRSWQHLFYMRASTEIGGKGGAHPKFQELIDETFKLTQEVYPIAIKTILAA